MDAREGCNAKPKDACDLFSILDVARDEVRRESKVTAFILT